VEPLARTNSKESDLFKILSHPTRAKIIELLYEKVEQSYTELLHTLGIDTGQLNFHLKSMADLTETTEEGTYILSEKGKLAYRVLKDVEKIEGKREEPVVAEARASLLKRLLANVIDMLLLIGVPFTLIFILSLWLPFRYLDPVSIVEFLHALFSLALVALTLLEVHNGQTIGKYLLGLRVISVNGRKLRIIEATLRNIAKIFFLPLDLLVGWLCYRKEGYIRFSDYLIKAKVVDLSAGG
jgi:uncharacterized RDD family membrane protein YckC